MDNIAVAAEKIQFVSLDAAERSLPRFFDDETSAWLIAEFVVRDDECWLQFDVVQENRGKAAKSKRYWEWRSDDGSPKCVCTAVNGCVSTALQSTRPARHPPADVTAILPLPRPQRTLRQHSL